MKCSKCGKKINGKYMIGDRGGNYHPDCFPKKDKSYRYVKK